MNSCLEQIIWVENPLIVSTKVRANCFARSKAHLQCDLGPSPVFTDHIKASLLFDQLDRDRGQIHVYIHISFSKRPLRKYRTAFSTIVFLITCQQQNQVICFKLCTCAAREGITSVLPCKAHTSPEFYAQHEEFSMYNPAVPELCYLIQEVELHSGLGL